MGIFNKIMQYSYGNALVILAGLISFPVFTRLLSPENYGLMSLLNLAASLSLVFAKGGLQQALVKFWDNQRGGRYRDQIVSTAFCGTALVAAAVLSLFLVATLLYAWLKGEPGLVLFGVIIGALVLFDAGKLILLNIYRSLQDVKRYNLVLVGTKYLQILFALLLVFFLSPSVTNVFLGFIAGSALVVLGLMATTRGSFEITLGGFDKGLFRSMLGFGWPLVIYELLNQLLVYGDRIVIKYFMGNEAVGLYSAAYNLTFNVQTIMVSSVSLAIFPVVVERMNAAGLSEARHYIDRSIGQFVLYAGLITVGFAAVGPDLLILLSGKGYREGALVIAPIIWGALAYGVFNVASGELFVTGKTRHMTGFMLLAAVVNILLNLWLVPRLGILGAGYATLSSQCLLGAVGIVHLGGLGRLRRCVRYLYYGLPAFLVYPVLTHVAASTTWSSVLGRSLLGLLLWVGLSLVLIAEFRQRCLVWTSSVAAMLNPWSAK